MTGPERVTGEPEQVTGEPERASAGDVAAIHALRRSLEDWMTAHGIEQWPVGSQSAARIAAGVADGQWWVLRDDAGVVAAVRIVRTDPDYWGDDDTPALYVHGLMVDRRASGSGLGRGLVEWAGRRAAAEGVAWLRLDHRSSNPHLDALYGSWGFEPVAETDRPGYLVVLMQRPVAPEATA
ncbi:GNAT family N-acetyltransferase [Cellulomonas composti]|uniref:GNAT family N-acetyltransferase n=1 Tax=Cellulomonas composti TaxID=266130 RepID=UPI0024831CEB|nr:GNAT family N-acetyltransferase [Cellulomonas composti]